jgi:transcription initiation factor TFIIIB Brf1 subunit/transcription initiation factor TFIIB
MEVHLAVCPKCGNRFLVALLEGEDEVRCHTCGAVMELRIPPYNGDDDSPESHQMG